MDVRIDILSTNFVVPKNKKLKNIWINLYGIENITPKRLKYMADVFLNNPKANRLIINASDQVEEELKIFGKVHNAQFIK